MQRAREGHRIPKPLPAPSSNRSAREVLQDLEVMIQNCDCVLILTGAYGNRKKRQLYEAEIRCLLQSVRRILTRMTAMQHDEFAS